MNLLMTSPQRFVLLLVGLGDAFWCYYSSTLFQTWGPFLENPGNLPGPISIFLNVLSLITQGLQTWYLANIFIEL